MIIEEFDFYYALSPKMQTKLVNFLFFDFKKQFQAFFDPCEQGFKNELIVNLSSRSIPTGYCLQSPGRKVENFYFITEGFVSVTGPRQAQPFLLLPESSYLGDYQILFDLKSKFYFNVYPQLKDQTSLDQVRKEGFLPPLKYVDDTKTKNLFMSVTADNFLRIAELYPKTMEDLKMRALERRKFF